ncbi:MAG: antirestriction protein ArdA [Acidimicrobiales bacterium]|nr:antirestriction protein ArdA [Acidimicrobiales bacterium]
MEGEPQQQKQTQEDHRDAAVNGPDAEQRERQEAITPRIYVASLADYNAGRLHGAWIDAAQDPDELHGQISSMLDDSPEPYAEEWAIHDFEGFNGLHLGEWENLEHVSRVANGIVEHGVAFAHWATLVESDEDLEHFEDAYLGRWDSLTEFAENIFSDLGLDQEIDAHVPEYLQPYVKLDAEGYGRDMALSGEIAAIEAEEGGVYVFRGQW